MDVDAQMIALEREALEMTYYGQMTVTGTRPLVTEWGETREEPTLLYQAIPCALSKAGGSQVNGKEGYSAIHYAALLFLSPEILIPPGSEIQVMQDGMHYHFIHSGEAFIYPTHQEITIERLGKA